MPQLPFGTQLVGQTENAFGAILDRELAGTALSRDRWVALTVVVMSGGSTPRSQLVARVSGALKLDPGAVQEAIAALLEAGLLEASDGATPVVSATAAGRGLQTRVRTAVGDITARLWGDIPSADLDVAARVLNTVLERADAELDGAHSRE
jgi:DNA-binding MarR family transcriptional regulator